MNKNIPKVPYEKQKGTYLFPPSRLEGSRIKKDTKKEKAKK